MKKMLVALIAVFFTMPACAAGVFENGNAIYELCSGQYDAVSSAYFYIAGLEDALETMHSLNNIRRTFCLPQRMTVSQLGQVGCKYLADHPESRSYSAPTLIGAAFMQAFPCPENPPP